VPICSTVFTGSGKASICTICADLTRAAARPACAGSCALTSSATRCASSTLKALWARGRASVNDLAIAPLRLATSASGSPRSASSAARSRHDPEIDTQLAIALRRAGRPEDALARLKRATKRQPPYAPAFHEFGCLLASLERHDEAIEAFRRGLDVAPMMPELSIQLGNALLQRRRCADAKIAFARALAISPDSADALLGMAKAHQEVGESEAAAQYFRRCLVMRPNEADIWLNLGHCLMELGQRDAGYDCFRAAARGDAKRYGKALSSLAASSRGRFWLKPSAAARYFRDRKS